MNDRIRLLAEQAGIELPDSSAYNGHIYRNSIEKFGELIVFECIKLAVFKGDSATGKAIKKHFGVEE